MPDHPSIPTLLRSSSQAPSGYTGRSIPSLRSGSHRSSLATFKASTRSQNMESYTAVDVLENTETGRSNAHATAPQSSPASATQLTAIPARSRRLSVISSCPSPLTRRPQSRRPASAMVKIDDTFSSIPLDTNSDKLSSSVSDFRSTPVAAISMSSFSQVPENEKSLKKQISYLARSGLVFLRRKIVSLPILRLSTFDTTRLPSPESRPSLGRALAGANPNSFLSAADKLSCKWPRPRSYRSIPPRLLYPYGRLRDPKVAGGWSQADMEAVFRDSRGLGLHLVGQWTLHKWFLLASVTTVFLLGFTCLVFSLLTWFSAYPVAPVVLITDSPALTLLTFSSFLLLLASLVGITGTLLNSRPILAVYVLLLFPSFLSFISVGYVTYKKANFSLDAKVGEAWNLWYSPGARTVLQGALGCCGWSGPLHGAAASGMCYARSPLPGCHGPLVRFERDALSSAAGTVFSLVPIHLANIFIGLLCANHVTRRFGKGITPARYRLTAHDVFSASSNDKQATKPTKLPVPPLPAPNVYGAFREDRQNVTTYRRAHGKFEREPEACA